MCVCVCGGGGGGGGGGGAEFTQYVADISDLSVWECHLNLPVLL